MNILTRKAHGSVERCMGGGGKTFEKQIEFVRKLNDVGGRRVGFFFFVHLVHTRDFFFVLIFPLRKKKRINNNTRKNEKKYPRT